MGMVLSSRRQRYISRRKENYVVSLITSREMAKMLKRQ
jgi:hypothetical protein